jgi:hypothetical protein
VVEVISSKVDTVWDLLAGEVGLYFLIAMAKLQFQMSKFKFQIKSKFQMSKSSKFRSSFGICLPAGRQGF